MERVKLPGHTYAFVGRTLVDGCGAPSPGCYASSINRDQCGLHWYLALSLAALGTASSFAATHIDVFHNVLDQGLHCDSGGCLQ